MGGAQGTTEAIGLAAAFDAMLDRLERSAQVQRRLIEETSHELRTPLAVLITGADVLLRHPEPDLDLYREGLERSRNAAERLRDAVGELLVDARGRARVIDRRPTDVSALVREVFEEVGGVRRREVGASGAARGPGRGGAGGRSERATGGGEPGPQRGQARPGGHGRRSRGGALGGRDQRGRHRCRPGCPCGAARSGLRAVLARRGRAGHGPGAADREADRAGARRRGRTPRVGPGMPVPAAPAGAGDAKRRAARERPGCAWPIRSP